MKSLIATIVLCGLMILATAANFVYVNHISDEMLETLSALPSINDPACLESLDALCAKWEKHAPIVGLTVGFLAVDKLTEHCQTLRSCATVGDVYGFSSTLTLLTDSIDDVRRLEQFSIENLF